MGVHKVAVANGWPIRLRVANTFFRRLVGVCFRRLYWDEAVLITPCKAIHTFGCTPLGVVFLDREGRVLEAYPFVYPNRILWCRQAHSVLEFSALSPLCSLKPGDLIVEHLT